MPKQRLVLKVGTNVLLRPNGRLDYNLISELAETISTIRAQNHEVILVSSGSVGAGRELIRPSKKTSNPLHESQILAAVGQVRLMQIYGDFFREYQIPVAQVLLTRQDFGGRSSYLNIRNTLEGLLQAGALPIVNENDVVAVEELKVYQFGENDQLAVYTAAVSGADRLFFLTTAPGLMREEPTPTGPKRVVVPEVREVSREVMTWCQPTKTHVGKGGMESKVRCAAMAMEFGIEAHILDGKAPQGVLEVLEGQRCGTRFVAHGRKVNSYQKWLAAGALNQGTLWIDAGAERALQEHKSSLLAKGILRVSGSFDVKDLVEIIGPSSGKLGVGRVAFTARELRQQLEEFQARPESRSHPTLTRPVVHRNHLYLSGTPAPHPAAEPAEAP